MNTGMLWLDADDRRTLEEKVQRAADYYEDKYGEVPNLCLVNVRMVEKELDVRGIHVRPVKNVLRNHLWLGLDRDSRTQTS